MDNLRTLKGKNHGHQYLDKKTKNVIGRKWVFRNKLNENGEITRKKDWLVCKGYAQEEDVDYGEIIYPIERLGFRTLLAYSTYKGFKVYYMDFKPIFLNGICEQEVHIEKPEGFMYPSRKNMVSKLQKDLYGLKQGPRAWYERMNNYMVNIGFLRTN